MNFGFSEMATHSVNAPIACDFSRKLLHVIHENTDCRYTCTNAPDGFLLKPCWKNMPYRNSFVPEINISISPADEKSVLRILGRPAKSTRIFFGFWFGLLLIIQVVLLAAYVFGSADLAVLLTLVPFFAFGYMLCKLGTFFTFRSVVRAIQKGFP